MTHRKQYLVGLGIPSYSGYIQFVVVTWKDVRKLYTSNHEVTDFSKCGL